MSVQSAAAYRNVNTAIRRSTDTPGLSVVPAPAPSGGFFGTLILCTAIFLTAVIAAFCLNTKMVEGAYEVRTMKMDLSRVESDAEALSTAVMSLSTPDRLQKSASDLGMVPAADVKYLNYKSGKITAEEKR